MIKFKDLNIIIKLILILILMVILFLLIKFFYIKTLENKLDKLYDSPISINKIYKDYTYDEYIDHITIMTYEGKDKKVIIPSYINNKPVYSIDDSCFYGNQYIEEVTIPSTVIRIGHQTFIGCDNLEKVYLPNNILDIGDWAFRVCPKLKNIYVKKNSISLNTLKQSYFKNYITYY